MHISFIAIDRIVQQKVAIDQNYREQLRRIGRPTLADGRALSDEVLVEKLHSLGLSEFSRDWLSEMSITHWSAESLAEQFIEQEDAEPSVQGEDWFWIALVCLWERWFPERPNFEMIDDRIQAGYEIWDDGESVQACRIWLEAWRGIKQLMRDFELDTIVAFDEAFGGTQSVFNWVQDFASELYAVGTSDPSLLRQHISVCKWVLSVAHKSRRDRSLIRNFQQALANSQAELNDDSAPTDQDAGDAEYLDAIIERLDQPHDGVLPEGAIRAAQQCSRAITPRLIELIRSATHCVRAGDDPPGNGHFFALFLLAEFRAKEALPAILEAISLPGEGPFDLFGDDTITECLHRVLAALAYDSIELTEGILGSEAHNNYVRSAAARSWMLMVRDGHLTREQAVQRLGSHLAEAIARRDSEGATHIIAALFDYSPRELLGDIETAYRQDLVDEVDIGRATIEKTIAEGDAVFQDALRHCCPTGFDDTVEELKCWHAFVEDDPWRDEITTSFDDWEGSDREGSDGDDCDRKSGHRAFLPALVMPGGLPEPSVPPTTIHNPIARVGRNQPCPCGSGRKFKKCCGSH